MKVSTTRMRGRELLEFKQNLYQEIQKDTNQVLKDREMQAGCRAQWMLLVALSRRFGFGKKRIAQLLDEVNKMLPDLIEDREAEVMDDMLLRYLKSLGCNVDDFFKEYFEADERIKQFGKFIDREKEKKEAEKKEKELLEKLKRHEMIYGKECV